MDQVFDLEQNPIGVMETLPKGFKGENDQRMDRDSI